MSDWKKIETQPGDVYFDADTARISPVGPAIHKSRYEPCVIVHVDGVAVYALALVPANLEVLRPYLPPDMIAKWDKKLRAEAAAKAAAKAVEDGPDAEPAKPRRGRPRKRPANVE